jgi:2-aminoadipate transaminase
VNGSQQCLDLFAKIFINPGDCVGMERPGYLGAIEAFSLYEPAFAAVPLDSEGPDPAAFEAMTKKTPVKFFYGIPNSQNPSGCTYSEDRRKAIAECLEGTDSVFYEDDAFGELFFDGKPRLPVKHYLPEQSVISGSFSKITAPGMRIGWMYAPKEILAAFNTAKQAADLHSNFLCQQILARYLETHDLDAHIKKIVAVYSRQCRLMCDLFDDLMPALTHTTPEGGMFLTATLPIGMPAMQVFREGINRKVAVLPGMPFFVDSGGDDTIRLNFSSSDEEKIKEGMHRLAGVINNLLRA